MPIPDLIIYMLVIVLRKNQILFKNLKTNKCVF